LYNPVTGTSNADIHTSWNTTYSVWQVTIRNLTSFSGFFITTENATPLPVTLLDFSAQKQENAVTLNWQTTEESNSDHFEIQRSNDAKSWAALGEVKAKGESKGLATYSFIDNTPNADDQQLTVIYYCLKMIDRDNTFAYSRIVSVSFQRKMEIKIFPNPAIRELNFTSDTPVVRYKIINPAGITVLEKVGIEKSTATIKLPDIREGLYLLQLTRKDGTLHTKQVVIMQ